MAPSPLRFRRALSLSSSLLHRHFSVPRPSLPLLHHLTNQIPKTHTLTPSPPRFFTSTTISLSSRPRSFANSNDNDEIGPDTILFEGCDYNHWLIVVDFPRDNKPPSEEMVKFYEETASKVFGSLEEAKKKIYACSTTTYTGFQVECSEETSEKFSNLPGVIFVLPDSYIDPANKEYGGDKYINGNIIPRPPPIQYGRSGPRREFRSQPSPRGPMEGENRNYGPPVTPQNPPQQNYGPPQQQNYGPPQRQNFGPPRQNYGPPPQQNYGPPQQQNYGPPPRQNHGPPPQQNYGPPQQPNYGPPPQQNNDLPPQQSYGPPQQRNYGPPPQQNNFPPPQQNFGPPPQQNNFPPPQQNFAPPGEGRVPVPPSDVPTGWDNPQNGRGDRMPSSQMHYNQGEHKNFYPHGQRDQRNYETPEKRDFPGLPSQGGNIEQAPPIAQGQEPNAAYSQNYQRQY